MYGILENEIIQLLAVRQGFCAARQIGLIV
jgi:hypothetical protein